jgi:hypothetical protein
MVRCAMESAAIGYEEGVVNSEGGLQAIVWHELRAQFSKHAREGFLLLVQPKLVLRDGTRRHPDIVVCNRDRVIGIIELKFAPKGNPRATRDHEKFRRLAACKNLSVHRERWAGPQQLKSFPVAKDVLFVWGAIGKWPSEGKSPSEALGARYVELVYSTALHCFEPPPIG